MKMLKMMNKRFLIPVLAFALFLLAFMPTQVRASDESEVRGVVQTIFEQLKNAQYDQLYESLPAASRSKISRERFTDSLKRASGMYHLERMEIGAVRVSGNLAAVDTVMYGGIERPVQAEGKIVAQQYLVREDGRWRVATGDTATVRRFLAANPGFARTFQIRQPRVYMKQNGNWVDLTPALKQMRRPG